MFFGNFQRQATGHHVCQQIKEKRAHTWVEASGIAAADGQHAILTHRNQHHGFYPLGPGAKQVITFIATQSSANTVTFFQVFLELLQLRIIAVDVVQRCLGPRFNFEVEQGDVEYVGFEFGQ